jgi:hypothetical protein
MGTTARERLLNGRLSPYLTRQTVSSPRRLTLYYSEGEAVSFFYPLLRSALPMMTSPVSRKHVLALLGSLLTSARGDDFCIVRLALPFPTSGPSEPLLDDPITDFVGVADSVLARQGKAQGNAGPDGRTPFPRCGPVACPSRPISPALAMSSAPACAVRLCRLPACPCPRRTPDGAGPHGRDPVAGRTDAREAAARRESGRARWPAGTVRSVAGSRERARPTGPR